MTYKVGLGEGSRVFRLLQSVHLFEELDLTQNVIHLL